MNLQCGICAYFNITKVSLTIANILNPELNPTAIKSPLGWSETESGSYGNVYVKIPFF